MTDQGAVPQVLFKNADSGSQVSINSKLASWISKIDQDPSAPEVLRKRCRTINEENPKCIPLSMVKDIAIFASESRERGKTPKTLSAYTDDFLNGCKFFFAEGPAPVKRDRDNETVVEKIRNDAAEREYERMTKNVGHKRNKGEASSFAADLKVANKESMAVFNCFLTVIGAGVFTYFATGLAVGNHLVAQVLMAILVSCVVAVADIYFLIKKLHNNDVLIDGGKQKTTGIRTSDVSLQKSKDD